MQTRLATTVEHRFWLEAQLSPGHPAYQVVVAHRIGGDPDPARWEAAVEAVVARHPVLRSAWVREGAELWVRTAESVIVPWTRLDEGDVQTLFDAVHLPPFELEVGPPIRAGWLRTGPDTLVVAVCIHHIAVDGASVTLFFRDLAEAWSGDVRPSPIPAPPAPTPEDTAAVARWVDELASGPLGVELPGWGAGVGSVRDELWFELSAVEAAGLATLKQQTGASFFEVVTGVWLAALARLLRERRLVLSYAVSLRPPELADVFGCFVNNLPLQIDVHPEEPVSDVILAVREARSWHREIQHVPLTQLVSRLRAGGRLRSGAPFLNVGVAHTHLRQVPLRLDGVEVHPLRPPPVDSLWDLLLEYDREDGDRFRLGARRDRVPPWLMAWLVAEWRGLLVAAGAAPAAGVRELPWVLPADQVERHAPRWVPVEAGRTLATRFAEVVARTPDAVAVRDRGVNWTYRRLAEHVHGLAADLLRAMGRTPEPGEPIGLVCRRGVEAVAGMLAIVEIGAAYFPLRAEDPPSRIASMLREAGANAVLTQRDLVERLGGTTRTVWMIELQASSGAGPPVPAIRDADQAAYIMATSGSSGRPKLTVVPHRGVLRLICDQEELGFGPSDRVVQASSLAFDAATLEIWAALLHGGTLVVPEADEVVTPSRLRLLLEREQITVLWLTAALFHHHAGQDPSMFGGLRLLAAGGDVLDPDAVRRVLDAPGGRPGRVINGYGPTENTTFTAIAVLDDPPADRPLPIGRPLTNTSCYVVDDMGARVPAGVAGELWTGGLGVALGYLHEPERTEARFIPNPFATDEDRELGRNAVLYRTGDRARWRGDGQLEFLGRLDAQVKIRGFRVEPAEVEVAARSVRGVADVAVVAHEHGGDTTLVAWYALAVGASAEEVGGELRARLMAELPDYMVPSWCVRQDTLPRTPNGKLDRRALAALDPREAPAVAGPAPDLPSTPMEHALAAIWAGVLGRPRIPVHVGFLALGGDSLRALELVARVRDELGRPLELDEVFRLQTVAAIAALLDQRREGDAADPVNSHTRPPDELALSRYQLGHWALLRRGKAFQCCFLLHSASPLEPERLERAWDAVLGRHEVFWLEVDLKRPRMRRQTRGRGRLECLDLTPLPDAAVKWRRVQDVVRARSRAPYDGRTPAASAVLLHDADQAWLLLVAPHVLVDGFSLELVARELREVYLALGEGREPVLGPKPLPLHDLLRWEDEVVDVAYVERAVAFYRDRLQGDASWTVPRAALAEETGGRVRVLPGPALARLDHVARGLGCSLESMLSWCVFLTLHIVHRTELVRCLSAYSNRDALGLRRVPFMLANALFSQSRLDPDARFDDAARAFASAQLDTYRHARLPPVVFFALSRLLFLRGTTAHLPLTPTLAAWAARLAPDRSREELAYGADLLLTAPIYDLWRWWVGHTSSARVRTVGCMINVTTSLTDPPKLSRGPLPLSWVRMPIDVPETIPGNPMIELFRDAEGVKVMFQARWRNRWLEAFLDTFVAVIHRTSEDPTVTLGQLRDELEQLSSVFET